MVLLGLRWSLGAKDVVYHSVAMSVHRPQRVGHILKISVSSVHGQGCVGALPLIDIAAHCLCSVDVEADDVVPWRVVKVVHTLLALRVVLVVLLGCVVVL